jgi:pyrimidine operon attenuation protein/uracil phosphoribosyltransferase
MMKMNKRTSKTVVVHGIKLQGIWVNNRFQVKLRSSCGRVSNSKSDLRISIKNYYDEPVGYFR